MNAAPGRARGDLAKVVGETPGLGTVRRGVGLLVLILVCAIPVALAQQSAPTAASLVFDGVTVVDVELGKLLPAQRVVITGNHIQAVGSISKVQIPKGAQVVDARDKYLIPGFWDMHTHSQQLTRLFYPLFIANGVTGIRDAHSPVPLDTLRRWRQEILAGTRIGPPRQILSGLAFSDWFGGGGGCSAPRAGGSGHACVDSASARHLVDSLKAAGADMLKMYSLSPAMYAFIAGEARRVGLPFGGHADGSILLAQSVEGLPPDSSLVTGDVASDNGARIVDHAAAFWDCELNDSIAQCQSQAKRFRHNNTWWVPTFFFAGPTTPAINKSFDALGPAFWSDSVLNPYVTVAPSGSTSAATIIPSAKYKFPFLRTAYDAGLPLLAGTDVSPYSLSRWLTPPGFWLHAELALYVAAGLTPWEALQTATLNPAKMLGGTDSLGTVARGKLADLVLLDANPLANITNTMTIRAVVANGRYFDRAALDRLLAEAKAKVKAEQLIATP